MTDTHIRCPNCGYEIPISEALSAQIRGELETALKADHEARLKQAVAEAERRARGTLDIELADLKAQIAERARQAEAASARELELRAKARELEEEQKAQAERIRAEVEARLGQESAERIAQAAAAAEAKAREQGALELKQLQEDLAAQREKARIAQEAELTLRQEKTALEARARELDLEVARKLDAAKAELETGIRKAAAEEQDLKLKEKEKQISDLRAALEDAKRRSELGSQELQGEILELDIQAALERQFPADRIEPVLKGARGADIQRRVRNDRSAAPRPCTGPCKESSGPDSSPSPPWSSTTTPFWRTPAKTHDPGASPLGAPPPARPIAQGAQLTNRGSIPAMRSKSRSSCKSGTRCSIASWAIRQSCGLRGVYPAHRQRAYRLPASA